MKGLSFEDSVVDIIKNSIPVRLQNDVNNILDEIAKQGSDELQAAIKKSRAVVYE